MVGISGWSWVGICWCVLLGLWCGYFGFVGLNCFGFTSGGFCFSCWILFCLLIWCWVDALRVVLLEWGWFG